ncbi:hypothetical protein QFC22_002658 [Naganishia vaughanmartiniae]|uniref:Uncharacterized protein n=1 Tax=Naganishia vaughanmartiniae TaxID=1424756 RepID=A0ACC2X9Y4_9TREE|nr:hypothetical protein QFC22_002658 [Naganishia vaughanmartiniae]
MSSMVIAGNLPASFIPVEFTSPRPQHVASSTSSSSSTSSHRAAKQPNLVDLLQPNYRYLLSPPRTTTIGGPLPAHRISTGDSGGADATASAGSTQLPNAEPRKVKRKGEAFKSPPLEPAVTTISNAPTGPSSAEPLVYVGTINYQFILSSCQSLAHGGGSNRSHSGSNDTSNGSSSKNSKKKGSRSKTTGANGGDSKGKGNDRSTTDGQSKQNKGITASGSLQNTRARRSSEEPRGKSTRPSRAVSQQRNNPSAPLDASKRTSPTRKASGKDTSDPGLGMEDMVEKRASTSAKQSSSLVPPPATSHTNLHHLAPPSPLRQSAVPVRLANVSRAPSQSALTALTRSSSQGTLSSPIDIESSIDAGVATRPLKRRRLSADSSLEKPMDDEHDLSKKLRRALAAESLTNDASDLVKRATTSSARPVRYGTRYATRSAPNSPPEAAEDTFPSTSESLESVSAAGATVVAEALVVGRAGRIMRRAVSHDVLPEEKQDLQVR